jgi:hypothetical protein
MKVHSILSKTLISDVKYRGKLRDRDVYVYKGGVKIFTGASPDFVKNEIIKLFSDIKNRKRINHKLYLLFRLNDSFDIRSNSPVC